MARTRHIIVVAATLSLLAAGCGSDGVSEPSSDPSSAATSAPVATAPVETTAVPSTTQSAADENTTTTAITGSTQAASTTLAPVVGDLLDPAVWIGRHYAEESMADPFAHAILDGTVTDFITMRYGAPSESDPIAYPAFVRPDPGGYGYSGTEAGPWVVLAWRPADPMNWPAGGPVSDALLTTSSENEMPMSGCRSVEGASGVFLGFVRYDPTYRSDGAETAPFPVTQAWRITDDLRLEPVAAEGVACDWFEFG